MVEVSNKQITKVIVYYSDGSYEEIMKMNVSPVAPVVPMHPDRYTYRCQVCGGTHAIGIQCTRLTVTCGVGLEDSGK